MTTVTALQRRIDNVDGFSFKVPQHYLPELVQPIGGVDTVPAAHVRRLLLLVAVILFLALEPEPKVVEQYQHVVIHASLRREGVNGDMDWYCPA